MSGHGVEWENRLECEINAKKRAWLLEFSRPTVLLADVLDLASDEGVLNHATGEVESVPRNLFIFSFGFSCKDLSSLNNHSKEFASQCIRTGEGTTGRTWRGNVDFLQVSRPAIALIENVPSAKRGDNWVQIQNDLKNAGYRVVAQIISSLECAVPQDRPRAWFCAARVDCVPDNWDQIFCDCLESMKQSELLPLEKFILPCDHPYVEKVMEQKRLIAERREARAAARRLAQETTQVKPQETKKKTQKKAQVKPQETKQKTKAPAKVIVRRHGKKWMADHWKLRRQLGMPVPVPGMEPPLVTEAAQCTGLCDRERDLLRLFVEAPVQRESSTLAPVELKHSAPRVIHSRQKRTDSTSCLLPASKIMLFPPMTQRPRSTRN